MSKLLEAKVEIKVHTNAYVLSDTNVFTAKREWMHGEDCNPSYITLEDEYPVDDIEFKESIVTTPNVVSTPKTIKDSQVLGRMRGSGDSGGFTGQKKRADYARTQRNLSNDRRRNDMLRAIRSTQDTYTSPDSIFQGVPESALMAKKGGRIVKGKKTAVRRRKK